MQEILQAISTVGFPIVGCVALFWQLNQTSKQSKEENEKMLNAINNNTIALTKLCERMGVDTNA